MPDRPLTGRVAWAGDVPIGWIRMRPEDDPDLVLLVELGNAHPRPTQGLGGGWQVIDRPGRTGITYWSGHQPMAYDIELFFDDPDEKSVEDALETLEGMAGRGTKRHGTEPPLLKVDTSGLMPHDFHSDPDTRWVINGWDEANGEDDPLVNDHGNRYRQTVTVTLMQFVADERVSSLSANLFLTQKPKGKTYRVKAGETLIMIAAKQLGDASRWQDIADKNNLRDPRSIRQGALLRLP